MKENSCNIYGIPVYYEASEDMSINMIIYNFYFFIIFFFK